MKFLSVAVSLALFLSSAVQSGAAVVKGMPLNLASTAGLDAAPLAAFMGAQALPGTALSAAVLAIPGALAAPMARRVEVVAPASAARLNAMAARPVGQRDASGAMFDGAVLSPAFEPPTVAVAEPESYGREAENDEGDNIPKRPELSFQPAAKTSLLSIDPERGFFGTMKVYKDSIWSKEWWSPYKVGAEINVVVRGENVFNRPTKIKQIYVKRIGDLQREDFIGTVAPHLLQAGVVALRKDLVSSLDETRRRFNPGDDAIDLDTKVRVIKFQSYVELYREAHGPDSIPQPEVPAERVPLKVKPEGLLARLSMFLPRAVFLDLDLFDGPISKDLLSDIAKLQRTGVYFVAFSRKPYAAAGSMRDKLVRQLSSYQLGMLMPIRFMMVTDDGAVVSELPRSGGPEPVDVLRFTPTEIDVLRDAVMRSAEHTGLTPRSLKEVRQPPLEDASERFGANVSERRLGPDPRVRFTVQLPKSMPAEAIVAWKEFFDSAMRAQGMSVYTSMVDLPDGRREFSASRTDLAGSMGRLYAALGKQFGLYLNPGDALVLSADPSLMAANPKSIDVGAITGLRGAELVENALGLMLGEHRYNVEGDLAGSASRMISYSYNRGRYLSEALIQTDKEEQNINFFSGHVVHSAEDWLIWNLQNNRIPSKDEFAEHLRERWDEGMREFKPVGMPPAHQSERWLKSSLTRALNMFDIVVRSYKKGEVLIGSEIPNFFMLKDYQRRSGQLKRRYVLHTIFDFVALRPDPKRPGHATLVIYDFKTGPAKTMPKLNKDIQVLTYALFAHEKWVGEEFPTPYLAGDQSYIIDDVSVEFVYSLKLQTTDISQWKLDKTRTKIIGTLGRINASEQKLFGYTPGGQPTQTKSPKKGETSKKKPAKRAKQRKTAAGR